MHSHVVPAQIPWLYGQFFPTIHSWERVNENKGKNKKKIILVILFY